MDPLISAVSAIVSPVYLVGGSVRDALLGETPADYDFATPLSPDEVEEAVRRVERRPYITGKRFGTVGFKVNGHFVEVTSFRNERYLEGSRKPEVSFGLTLEDDLMRRDFTMNAIAKDTKGTTIDPFGGVADIENETIRTVGDPDERFAEDPLRMLRAARFVSQLGFFVEEKTFVALRTNAWRLTTISKERINAELNKLLLGKQSERALRLIAETDLLTWIVPELSLQVTNASVWESTLDTVAKADKTIESKWAAFLSKIEQPFLASSYTQQKISHPESLKKLRVDFAVKIGISLRWSKKRTQEIVELLQVDG